MGYRMLLGREAMSGHILVDPAASFTQGEHTQDDIRELYKHPVKAMNGLKIGILASNPNLYSNQRLLEAGEQLGHGIYTWWQFIE